VIAAVGRLKDGPERVLFGRYAVRLQGMARAVCLGPLTVAEVMESKAVSAQMRRAAEAQELLGKAPEDARLVALDEKGQAITSAAFAQLLGSWRDGGAACTAFLMGGPDGHGRDALDRADKVLSLGPMTLPHGLARVVLAEQLYRAATILANHPYHRS
jgi:23S rRNA (pseudouridine1915-N3)-methyltransferase